MYNISKKNDLGELIQYVLHEKEINVNIGKNNLNVHGVSFSGHKKSLDKTGYEKHDFYYLYDTDKYDCELELFNISKDRKGNYSISDKKPAYTESLVSDSRMSGGKITLDMSEMYKLTSEEGFAYRYKLTDKTNDKNGAYGFDNGMVLNVLDEDAEKFNVVLNNRATINKNGAMQLIMTDGYYPGIENVNGIPTLNEGLRAKALSSVRTHANKLGGNFYGIIERLPEISKEGITRIVGTPFTRDTISSHLYWTENAYQVCPNFGTEEDFKQLQTELFKNGINWVSDAALVNEGFGGIHLSSLMRKGADSYAKDMFRADERIALGILPDVSKYTNMKLINSPMIVASDGTLSQNGDYNPAKPTFIQFYDSRLASKEQVESDSPLRMSTYDNKNTDNIYDITKHDDAVYPFPLEVSPTELTRNLKRVQKSFGKVELNNIETIKKVADFSNFSVVSKSDAGGLEVWDGNVDIAKLNFYRSKSDIARFSKLPEYEKQDAIDDFDRGALAVRDYAINSGKYWTKMTADTQFEYASSLLADNRQGKELDAKSYMKMINSLADKGSLPKLAKKVVDEEIVQNVLNGDYHSRLLDNADMRNPINPNGYGNDYSVSDYITRQAMDLPLETLPISTNLLGIITSPYLAKRANTEEELGVSRFDVMQAENPNLPDKYVSTYNQMDNIYTDFIAPIISEIVKDVPDIKDENGKVSEYGKYVIADITPDLTKYILLKALKKDVDVSIKDGHFDFSKVNSEDISMQSIGIPYEGKTAEQEAQIVINTLENGIRNIDPTKIQEIKHALTGRMTNRSLNDFKVAEMIMDRTESGLGWRIDAAKDIAAMDGVRTGVEDMTDAWNNVIDFWKSYNQAVLEINPHVYTTAEITDLFDLFEKNDHKFFDNDADAERKFLQETGITSVANYNYFFSKLPDLFAPLYLEDIDDSNGWQAGKEMNHQLIEKMAKGWSANPGFLFQSPEDGITNSYTFVGNHDKPRLLHMLGLDMHLFNTDYKVNGDKHFFDSYNEAEFINKLKNEGKKDNEIKEQMAPIKMIEAERNVTASVLNKNVEDIDFDKVKTQAIAMGARLNEAIDKEIDDETLKTMCKEAVADLAGGTFKGKKFDAEAFGTRPFEVAIKSVFDEVKYKNPENNIENREQYEAKLLQSILEPAFDRFYSIYKLLVALPGSPTDFAGDRVGLSGYETKAKNYHQQNRNIIHWEWLKDGDDNKYKFVKTFYDNMNNIANLRNNPKLSALNDGATITLPSEASEGDDKLRTQGFIRYNEDSLVLVLTDSAGASSKYNEEMNRNKKQYGGDKGTVDITAILNSKGNARNGLKFGIQVGTVFKNAREEDTAKYVVKQKSSGEYYLEKQVMINGKPSSLPITISDKDYNSLILYKV